MAIEVKRKKGETFEAFARRFSRRIMQSGVVLEYKKKAFKRKQLNRNLRKANTLSHKVYKEERDYLRKMGRLPEEPEVTKRRY